MTNFGDVRSAIAAKQDISRVLRDYDDPKVSHDNLLRYLYDHDKLPPILWWYIYEKIHPNIPENIYYSPSLKFLSENFYMNNYYMMRPSYQICDNIVQFGYVNSPKEAIMSGWWPFRYAILNDAWDEDVEPLHRAAVKAALTSPVKIRCDAATGEFSEFPDAQYYISKISGGSEGAMEASSAILANSLKDVSKYYFDIYSPTLDHNIIKGTFFRLNP